MYRYVQDPIHTITVIQCNSSVRITKGHAAVPTSLSFAERRFEVATCILGVHQWDHEIDGGIS